MKVKKFIVVAMFIAISAASANAQIQTATLQQEDNVQVFYGIDALKNAVNAAVDGNTIYLTAGNFNGLSNLAKAVKIIGAGGFNPVENKNTFIQDISIRRGDRTYTDYIELEGFVLKGNMDIYNSDKVRMRKIKFNSYFGFNSYNGNNFANIEIIQCLQTGPYINWNGNYSNIVITNSILKRFSSTVSSSSSVLVTNCIIYENDNSGFTYLTLQNNIIVANNSSATPNSVNNNIFAGANNFPNVNNQSGNWNNIVLSDLFVNQPENKWNASYDYHLKNPANYVGTDGTQVGIYGGLYSWNTTPGNPQIIESKVSPATSNDGKLDFQIKAEAQQ